MKRILLGAFLVILLDHNAVIGQNGLQPNRVTPTLKQIEYQEMELIGFIHFNMNTFTDKEWGYGDEDPQLFNPKAIDVEQWLQVAKAIGMKELLLTAKHHDGFCLWPSAFTEHSIKNSPYKNGSGDVVKEFTAACRKYGLRAGLYLSPWDRNNPTYGSPEYLVYYKNQLRELLSNYGEINEVWFDGANGGNGYYGGANETRIIDRKIYYPWPEFIRIVYELQPKATIFSDAGPDLRWIGNENGIAGDTFWSTIDTDNLVIGESEPGYLNIGDPNGKAWLVGVCDVSIRPGWFYHANEDRLVKSPPELMELYYQSVGRNAVLLLNLPPDQNGLIQENDIRSLREFRAILDETFRTNLAANAKATASTCRLNSPRFNPNLMLDEDNQTYWAAGNGSQKATIEITLDGVKEFDRILIQEPIFLGQRISSFEIQTFENRHCKTVAQATTIGYKRILKITPIRTRKIRILIRAANNPPAISTFALFKASDKEL